MVFYQILYTLDDLKRAQGFESEHESKRSGTRHPVQLMRFALFILVGLNVYNSLTITPFGVFIGYFTNWTLLITLSCILIGIFLAEFEFLTHEKWPNLHASHHILYSLMLFMNPIVVSVYWLLVHEEHLLEIATKYAHDVQLIEWKTQHTYLVHIVPPLCALIYMCISSTQIIREQGKYLALFGILYSISNYFQVKANGGKYLYWFMTWQDYRTPLNCLTIDLIFLAFYNMLGLLDEKITGRKYMVK